jgi:hypothetical protein
LKTNDDTIRNVNSDRDANTSDDRDGKVNEKGPRDVVVVSWGIGKFFFFFRVFTSSLLLTTF